MRKFEAANFFRQKMFLAIVFERNNFAIFLAKNVLTKNKLAEKICDQKTFNCRTYSRNEGTEELIAGRNEWTECHTFN